MMSAPSSARRSACARPCPRAAPVMKATLPSSFGICALRPDRDRQNWWMGDRESFGRRPAAGRAAVFAIPDAKWGEAIAAAVVLRDGAQVFDEELVLLDSGRRGLFHPPAGRTLAVPPLVRLLQRLGGATAGDRRGRVHHPHRTVRRGRAAGLLAADRLVRRVVLRHGLPAARPYDPARKR
jgi:acyl-CoA synthetase (AMP-forming)/AMP-acid ligase II